MLLAQVGDLLTPEIWVTAMSVGGAMPAACWLLGWRQKRRAYRQRTWAIPAIYYALAACLFMGYIVIIPRPEWESTPTFWLTFCSFSTMTIVAGPIVGFVLLLMAVSTSHDCHGHCRQCGRKLTGSTSDYCRECSAEVEGRATSSEGASGAPAPGSQGRGEKRG